MRLNNYVGDGPYAYLADRPTTIPARAPLVVFDTRVDPGGEGAGGAVRGLRARQAHDRARRASSHLRRRPAHAWAGRSFLVVDEAWKLIERPATGRWFNEFVRRSRHYALWLVAISQQLSDFENEHGRALLANARCGCSYARRPAELGLREGRRSASASEAVAAISNLRTVRGRPTARRI